MLYNYNYFNYRSKPPEIAENTHKAMVPYADKQLTPPTATTLNNRKHIHKPTKRVSHNRIIHEI
jgi:hypothetical protein